MPARSSRDKMSAHRETLRRKGLRPIQIWVPDTRSPDFREEARRQSRAVAAASEERDVAEFIDRVTDWDG